MFHATYGRADWQNPHQPVQSSFGFDWNSVDSIVVHYTASPELPDGDPGEFQSQVASYLRAIQNDYVTNRGYSIGYGYAFDAWGSSYELRGEQYRNAANKGSSWVHQHGDDYPDDPHNCNRHTISLLLLMDGVEPPTQAMQFEVQRFVEYARAFKPGIPVIGHRDLGATACPGDGIYQYIVDGLFEPDQGDTVSRFTPVNKRIFDSRKQGGMVVADRVLTMSALAKAVTINVTVFGGSQAGHISAASGTFGPGEGGTSVLTMQPGLVLANNYTVACDSQGRFSLKPVRDMHVIVDLIGVWS